MVGSRLVRLAVSAAMVATVAVVVPDAVAQAPQQYRFDIPSQDLGGALRAFGRATNQQIIFSERAVSGKRAPALIGRYSAEDGLRQLLSGTGLSTSRTSSGMYYLKTSAMTAGAATAAVAQTAPLTAGASTEETTEDQVVVTGSRIRRSDTDTAAPVRVFDRQELEERGFTQVGQMLNEVTSNTPSFPTSQGTGFPAGAGRTYPNLFSLGAGRTLTLLNGRRMVASDSGLGDRTVDTNVIPSGLIRRVDVVQAGGAAVYGSDAIAGVVNYVLRDDFEGIEVDLQNSISSRGDDWRPYARLTAGTNFGGGRGNIAVNLEFSKTDPLLEVDRPLTALSARNVPNPANVSTTDGISPTMWVLGGRMWQINNQGVIFSSTANSPNSLLRSGGQALQFSADGQGVTSYDPGLIQGTSSTAIGGQGRDWRELSTLQAGVRRYSGTLIGHFDLTEGVRLVGEFVYARQEADDPYGIQGITRSLTGSAASQGQAVTFNRTNPYLTAAAITALDAASPTFAAGGNLFLSRYFDILPNRNRHAETDTWRALVGFEGDFKAGEREFYYSLTASRGQTEGFSENPDKWANRFGNALNATRVGNTIVCAINADAITTNDDAACRPINPFGNTPASAEALAYITVMDGSSFKNVQDNYLATLGGDIVRLPAGTAKFSIAYEHRRETVDFTPAPAAQAGIVFNSGPSLPVSQGYKTNEFSGELLLPLVGRDFTLPLVKSLEATGSVRFVDHSIAGKETVWGVGGRWDTGLGITFRVSRSRNFRAPSLTQQFAPASVSGLPLGNDPCDADRIASGPAPATRRANCLALFTANPTYGVYTGGAAAGASAEARLATFQNPAENTGFMAVTNRGNPNLRNEIANTLTFGVVIQPEFIPGLTFTADRLQLDLSDGLSAFTPATFMAVCYDSTPYPNAACDTFTRDAQGFTPTGTSTTFNAGTLLYRGEIYNFNYRMPLSDWFKANVGTLEFGVEATHNDYYAQSSTGFNLGRSDGTIAVPAWRWRFDARYHLGSFRMFYSVYHLPASKASFTDTIETNPVPVLAANTRHTVSVQYELPRITFRAGVNNIFDEGPSFPSRSFGDINGRQFFVGAKVRL
ncbi:TonB-dependent receptor plug domain-containing protein [Sphingomonas sp.]|uniref:TonB-dependent receptor plug domain-containing protein n=1 Tax=Sphingomonas sp. TaxID=28214 RepID=UPI002DD66313|nr:TonB-dependent receptor plug domain-containing protein [Sphingomonas sp.]